MDKKDLRKLGKPLSHSQSDMRVDRYLGLEFPFLSRTSWQKRCLEGKVFNHHEQVKPSYRLKEGDQLFHYYPQAFEPEVQRGIFCIFQAKNMVAFYKPPHLPMHEGGRYRQNTFFQIIRTSFGPQWRAVHRLDRETSGIVICASNPQQRSALALAFRRRSMEKIYYGIGIGQPPGLMWQVNKPIGLTQETTWRTKRWVDPAGKEAITKFTVLARHRQYYMLKIIPIHGRTHQIRIHASYSGVPLLGDIRYHHNEQIFLEFLRSGYSSDVLTHIVAPRLCLHAGAIKFQLQQSDFSIVLPIPEDMRWIWQTLKKSPDLVASGLPDISDSLHKRYWRRYHIPMGRYSRYT
ncbi:MAG: RluA family pseudouridine synthase [Proteobacteria bacterium]|nr:RluA family pseudouridine synthase [Pseudomonadota bacterium]